MRDEPSIQMRPPSGEYERALLRSVPIPRASKLSYAAGSVLDLTVNTSINVFLLFYASVVCGLSAALSGGALAMGLIVDAVADPLIGSLSDNHHSRWGRRLPFMVLGAPVLLLSFVLLFSLPQLTNQWVLFATLSAACIAVRVSLSLFNLPYFAVGAEISDDAGERSDIIAWRWLAGMLAALVTVALGFSVFFKGPHGTGTRAAYAPFAMTLAAMMCVAAMLSMSAVRQTLPRQHLPPPRGSASVTGFFLELGELAANRTFLVVFVVALLFAAAQGITQSLGLHANTFFWRLTSDQIQLVTLAFPVGLILGAPCAGSIVARLERRTAAFIGLSGLILAQATPAALKLSGLLKPEVLPLAEVLALSALAGGAMTTVAAIALLSMITDAADEHELRFGARREGLYFASWSFASKAASGLGTFLSGIALQAINFPVGDVDSTTVLPAATANALGFIYGPGAAVLSALSVAVLLRYRLNRNTHSAILAELQRRRAVGRGHWASE
ncbi:MFS transporter [Solimonas terrae]|uniref:MFS transporter n=1 Tax=Solimonas terrae TaxID=1396819 RepID=A0A6M2BQ09_9GAMM|nr:MFS transporter [Solimonas terrae]NGY04157.1 MFS transporter [Solimonas terrae]